MPDAPLVSVVTPTRFQRHHYLPAIYYCLYCQTWPNVEWIVYDDGDVPSNFMESLRDSRVTYRHFTESMSIGLKRNLMVCQAQGQYIIHFDDDDYYSPQYIYFMVSKLAGTSSLLIKLSGFFLYNSMRRQIGYWDQLAMEGVLYMWGPGTGNSAIVVTDDNRHRFLDLHRGYGFSYAYQKAAFPDAAFADANWNEEGAFIDRCEQMGKVSFIKDDEGICLHFVHAGVSSLSYPQYIIPTFLLSKIFPHAADYFRMLGLSYGDPAT